MDLEAATWPPQGLFRSSPHFLQNRLATPPGRQANTASPLGLVFSFSSLVTVCRGSCSKKTLAQAHRLHSDPVSFK